MARPSAPASLTPTAMAVLAASGGVEQVSGNQLKAMASSAAIFRPNRKANPKTDRQSIAKQWQIEAYRHINICGEARYAASQFAAMAGRAEIGVSQPQTLSRKAVWVKEGPEVEVFAEIAPTVRERSKLIRDFMMHRVIAGECYLIARPRVDTDPGYIAPPLDNSGEEQSWDDYLASIIQKVDLFDPNYEPPTNPNADNPLWEIVAVTELQKVGKIWKVRHDNGNYIELGEDDPVIRMWTPDPENRREAWSPFRSMLTTLREIEWLTAHIFTQVRSRLMSAGVWFLPENLTFPPPPIDAVEGGEEAIAMMNEAERFMTSLAASAMTALDAEEVSFPSIVMADAAALAAIDQNKLIKFWSEIDDKAMTLRSSAIRRFALGFDMVPEKVLGASGIAVDGAGGSAGSVNHWGVWANEEQTIANDIEPALDDFTGTMTEAVLRSVIADTLLVIGYDTAALRLRQDRSKEAAEWYDRGVLKAEVALRENGFDPETDMMDKEEQRIWLLHKLVGGSPSPEQMQAAFLMITGKELPVALPVSGNPEEGKGVPGPSQPPSLEDHPYEGPPREQHDHSPAPFTALHASCEGLVLRALEKAGNRLLNDGKRGRDRDRTTPPHLAHLTASIQRTVIPDEFDFKFAPSMLDGMSAYGIEGTVRSLAAYCARLYNEGEGYSREGLMEALG